jgi:hypothetical protein
MNARKKAAQPPEDQLKSIEADLAALVQAPVDLPAALVGIDQDEEEAVAGLNPWPQGRAPTPIEHRLEVSAPVVAKSLPEITAAAQAASSSMEHAAVLRDLEDALTVARADVVRLESQRGRVVLDGIDLDEHRGQMQRGADLVAALTSARDEVAQRHSGAKKAEATAALEAAAARLGTTVTPKLSEAWRTFYASMQGLLDAGDAVTALLSEVVDFNYRAEQAERTDLKLQPATLRRAVVVDLAGGPAPVTPVSVVRMKGESDEAFDLRRGNAQALAQSASERADPMRSIGQEALSMIETLAFDLDAHQRSRRRLVNVQTYRTHHGQPGMRLADVPGADGRPLGGQDPKPQLGPHGRHGERQIEVQRTMGDIGFVSTPLAKS